jgi:LysM repeat protein
VTEDRLRVWAARFLAPLAFAAAAIVLVLLVQNGLSSDGSDDGATTVATVPTSPVANGGTGTGSQPPPPQRRFYRVRAGDTLESIADRFGTTTEELLRLNPGVDPLAINPGQRIRVR